MKQLNFKNLLLLGLLCLKFTALLAQCTEAKDSEMAKYKNLTMTQDAQGCSQCAMLAMYFCSAKYCVEMEDQRKVGALISACKQNIQNMGQPYCCPEYINKAPEWGIMGAAPNASSKSSSNNNPLLGSAPSSSGTSNQTTDATNKLTGQLLESLTKLDNGKSGSLTDFAKGYAQGQQLADTTEALTNLFSASPEEKARREQQRVETEKKALEDRQRMDQARIENENNAKNEFSEIIKKYNPSNPDNHNFLVINMMDNYISNKYYYDASQLIPEWSNWMKTAVANGDKFATTVFAGKALGFNFNKFNYSIGLTKEQAIQLLENVTASEDVFQPYIGISFAEGKKSIQEKNKKKKIIKKDINTFTVTNVSKGSAAELADLKKDDVILKYNDNYINDLFEQIKKTNIQDKVKLTILRENKEIIKEVTIGKRIADNHKVDAMILLANYYNTKTLGNDPEKALYFFTKAAENASPNAMFALGEIYKNNIFGNKKVNVKYKFKKNEEFALEWYLKSIQNMSYFNSRIYNIYKLGTYFEPASFDELIEMYKKGIGAEKNTEKANQILLLKNNYFEKINNK